MPTYPTESSASVGWITEQQMIEVDRVMIEDLGIQLLQMMENAGRNLARTVIDLFSPSSVAIACGSGGNGGGGMVAARHLANAGVAVSVTTTKEPADLTGVPAIQLEILRRMGIRASMELLPADCTIDAVIGYSLRGAPRGRSRELIETISNRSNVVALDNPSGLDVTAGTVPGGAVRADATLTLCLPKIGLGSSPLVGQLLLADISVPRTVTEPLGGAPDFRASPILQLVD